MMYRTKLILSIICVCVFLINSNAQTTLFSESFETDGEGSRYTSNTFNLCSGSPGANPDFFLRTNTNPALPPGTCASGHGTALTNLQGTYYWAGEDIRSSTPVPNANPPGDITTSSINVTNYNTLKVSLYLATSNNNNVRWEVSDSINIKASFDGVNYFTVGRFMGNAVTGGRLTIDENLNGAIDGAEVTYCDRLDFTKYIFSIAGTGTSLTIKLNFDQAGGTEELGIDLIEVTGTFAAPTNTTWNGSTWSNSAPTSTVDAIIASNTAPSSFTCKTLTINNGASLTTTGITATINGDITNNGNGIAGTGSLIIAANSALQGTAFDFNGTLTVNSGAILTTNSKLTLSSTSTNTARVATGTSAGGYISGNVTVQRFILGGVGRRKFRFLGHPFSTAMNVTELTDDIDITGAITGSNANGFTTTTSNSPSAFTFTEANGNGALNDAGWTALTSGNAISTILAGQGFRGLIRGSKGQANIFTGNPPAPNNVTLSMTGALRQGDFTQNLSYTSGTKGWNLISNPYASNVDWTLVTRTNVNDAIYTYRPSLNGGNYGTYINNSAANGGSQYIEAYCSFFVRTNAVGPSLGWQEADKVANNPTNTVFRTNNIIYNRISLTLINETTQDTDEVVVRFGYDAVTDVFDAKYDAYNLGGGAQDLYIVDTQQNKYSIYHGTALKAWQAEKREVVLGINNLVAGSYSFNTQTLNAITGNNKLYLKDALTNTLTDITNDNTYSFSISNNTTSINNRFSLVFNAKEKLASSIKELSIKLSPNPAKGKVQLTYSQPNELNTTVAIFNVLGKQVKNINLGKLQYGVKSIDVSTLTSGIYFVHFNNGIEVRTEKLIVEN